MLSFDKPPDPDRLSRRLAQDLANFRSWYEGFELPDPTPSELREVVPLHRIPRGVSLASGIPRERWGWHFQIFRRDKPKYYARGDFIRPRRGGESRWFVEWIGKRWLAEAVQAGIRRLDEEEDQLPASAVSLLSSRLYRFSSLVLEADQRHLIVHAHPSFEGLLPVLGWLTPRQLGKLLLERYGEEFGLGGVRAAEKGATGPQAVEAV